MDGAIKNSPMFILLQNHLCLSHSVVVVTTHVLIFRIVVIGGITVNSGESSITQSGFNMALMDLLCLCLLNIKEYVLIRRIKSYVNCQRIIAMERIKTDTTLLSFVVKWNFRYNARIPIRMLVDPLFRDRLVENARCVAVKGGISQTTV